MTGCARFAAAGIVAAAVLRAAPPNLTPPADYGAGSRLSPAEARAALESFRHAGPAQPAYLEFELQHLPHRGPKVVARGRLWAGRDADGAVIRLELEPGDRFLLQNGPHARVWRWSMGSAAVIPSSQPLQPGWEFTAFDLQMPFLYWPQAAAASLSRVRGRPADVFLFAAPAGLAPLMAVRAYLDSEYHAPVQIESLAAPERVLKTFSLLDVKSLAGQWLFKDLEVRDETTRNKTRLSVTGAALGLELGDTLFTPDGLADAVAAPAGLQRF